MTHAKTVYEPIINPNTGIKIWGHLPPLDQALLLVNVLADVLANADALVRELELQSNASGKKHLQLQMIECYAEQVFFQLKGIREAIEEARAAEVAERATNPEAQADAEVTGEGQQEAVS
jgi:hypothetical protein